jgi:hypothetical protein
MICRLLLVVLILGACKPAKLPVPKIYSAGVYKTATCSCCGGWIKHLEENGFAVTTTNQTYDELTAFTAAAGVPERLMSCHTAKIGGYVIEGHVPAAQIIRLLKEKPAIRGLTVPGMPIGSPGMEGAFAEKYQVLAIHHDGSTSVWATVEP